MRCITDEGEDVVTYGVMGGREVRGFDACMA